MQRNQFTNSFALRYAEHPALAPARDAVLPPGIWKDDDANSSAVQRWELEIQGVGHA